MNARPVVAAIVFGVVLPPACASSQSLEARIAAASGDVRFSFTSRPDVSGNGHSIIQWSCDGHRCRQQIDGNYSDVDEDDWRSACDTGPVRVTLRRREGRVTGLRTAVGGRASVFGTGTDLGRVAAPEAVRYLLDLATRAEGDVGSKAIFAATLADSATTWPELLRLARDRRVPQQTRSGAVFWVSQAAEVAATRGLDALVDEDDTDREVRKSAVFALSQRPREEGVPVLIRIAETNRDPEIRKQAIFWLGQSNDPRALALFEQLLTRP
jgi:hypothetical protein